MPCGTGHAGGCLSTLSVVPNFAMPASFGLLRASAPVVGLPYPMPLRRCSVVEDPFPGVNGTVRETLPSIRIMQPSPQPLGALVALLFQSSCTCFAHASMCSLCGVKLVWACSSPSRFHRITFNDVTDGSNLNSFQRPDPVTGTYHRAVSRRSPPGIASFQGIFQGEKQTVTA